MTDKLAAAIKARDEYTFQVLEAEFNDWQGEGFTTETVRQVLRHAIDRLKAAYEVDK